MPAAIFPYFGSKWSYASRITAEFPPTEYYNVYVDVFGGSGAMSANAPQVELMVYNDLDREIGNVMRVLRDHEEEFIRKVALTPYSLNEFKDTFDVERRENLIDTDPVEAARLFYVRASKAFGGYKGGGPRGWARAVTGRNSKLHSFNNLDKLYEFAKLVKNWQIESDTYQNLLDRYQGPTTLFYLDPPYLVDVCAEGRGQSYRYDLKSVDEHAELLEHVLKTEGYFVISGYESELYDDMLRGWGKVLLDGYTVLRTQDDDGTYSNNVVDRTEAVWLSPNVVNVRQRPLQIDMFSTALEVA